MDSDVSAEGDMDGESTHNRSPASSNSEQPSSPEIASDYEVSSEDESVAPAKPPACDSVGNSPAAKGASSVESSPDTQDASSDAESSPESPDEKQVNSNQESSPETKKFDSDRESSPEAKGVTSDQELSPQTNTPLRVTSDHESSPETKAVGSGRESSEAAERDSSPEGKSSDFEKDSSPEGVENAASEQEPSPPPHKEDVRSDHESSPEVKNQPLDRDSSSEQLTQSLNHEPSPEYMSTHSPGDAHYEILNGNMSPRKSPHSVVSDGRSDIASSLDSVSGSEGKPDFDGEDDSNDVEKSSEGKKKSIMDFADDLSDVSDIESNDSFDTQEPPARQEEEEHVKVEFQQDEIREEHINGDLNDIKQEDAVSLHADGEEQLDFEAEEGECSPKVVEKKLVVEEEEEPEEEEEEEEEEPKIEVKEPSDLEEGELSDDNDAKPEETERPVCRFFSRGHCTWGSNCRFIHPGVMDKGNYSMFDTVRPIVTPGGPPPPTPPGPVMYPGLPPHIIPPHIAERAAAGMLPPGALRKEEPPGESAWERGLRQAKEMIRKSSKRKETEVDFEDKKMNLTLSQDEIDKENDYYSRHSGSPPMKSPDIVDKWKMEADVKGHRSDAYPNDALPSIPHAGGGDGPPLGYYPPMHHRPDYWNHHRVGGGLPYDDYPIRAPHVPYGGPDYYSAAAGRRYMPPNSYYQPRPGVAPPPTHHADLYDRKQKHKPYPGSSREVIVQKNDKPYKDERYRGRRDESPRLDRSRDDEWADPWMRTKSPASGRRRRHRKNTYTSGSSYSSSSEGSRSSSRSSVSSRSHNSRSRSKGGRSSGSGSQSSSRSASESQANKKTPMQFKLSPSSRQQLPVPKRNPKPVSPSLMMVERRVANERGMHMNPPSPSPKVKVRPHSPPGGMAGSQASMVKPKGGLPDRLLAHSKAAVAAAMRSTRSSESRSSKSSSGSSSSDTSSDSSDSDSSSSSSGKSTKAPPVRVQKRNIQGDNVAMSQAVKVKAMDAMKLSGQKQQIKLTLKGSNSNASKRTAVIDHVDGRKDRQPIAGKKRVAESSASGSDSDTPAKKSKGNQKRNSGGGGSGAAGGVGGSRREELLKQLKAVEDAIARKRSRNV